MNPKKKAVEERIRRLQEALTRAAEYLDSGAHADWNGFRPYFTPKIRDGRRVPPHRGWVRSVFVPRKERALRKAEKVLQPLS